MTATVQELAAPVLSSPRQLDPDAGLMSKRRRGDLEAVEDTAALQLTSLRDYKTLYRLSLTDPEAFWGRVAEGFHWHKRWGPEFTRSNFDIRRGRISVEWFIGAETNMCYNAVDRHVAAGQGNRVAFFCEGNSPEDTRTITYRQLQAMVCKVANYLRSVGVKKGDNVSIYMPMVPELPAAMLACTRIGAIHSVVFAGFSAEALAARLLDSRPVVVLTASAVMRGAKPIGLKAIVDEAVTRCGSDGHEVPHVAVWHNAHAGKRADTPFQGGRDAWWHDVVDSQSAHCEIVWLDAETPLFKLFTSGSTGKPKGVEHTLAGYMVGAGTTFKYVFDYQVDDVFFCTADCGWITGHSYVAYGPLLHAATQVIFEGVPTYPDASRLWQICDKYSVTQLYTAPTAIRSLMSFGDAFVTEHSSRKSLRILGSVGEPINPEAWQWYHQVVGEGRCHVVDTYWQTETGAHMIAPLPGLTKLKPGSATLPFFGVEPAILDEQGREVEGEGEGRLVIKRAWPSCMRTLSGDHSRYEAVYFSTYPGYYFTGDGCRRDADGYYWLTGRVDDVINVSGHRIGTAEVEAALDSHPAVAEAAVVPCNHDIKGQGIYAFVSLMQGYSYPPEDKLKKELVATVRRVIGPIATPDVIHWAPGLPKTRSGKIMRRILRKIAAGEEESLGDISTLADPNVVTALLKLRGT